MARKRKDAILSAVRPRNTLGAAAGVWTAAEILHLAHAGPVDLGLASLAVTGLTGWKFGSKPAVAVGLTGGWLTLASEAGPWAGSGVWWHPMTILWGAGAVGTLIGLNMLTVVKEARAWRAAKRDWLHDAPRYGLFGSHLLHHEWTRLGERMRVDVTETGKLASSLAGSHLAETIAQERKLPPTRVRVSAAPIAGQIDISIRTEDPWADAILHPLIDSDPEITLSPRPSIRDPLIIGQDPETGKPLTLRVWTTHGGRNIFIVGKKDAGKTVLLNCIRERLTACPDAIVLGINVSKAIEDLEWARACHLTAVGDKQGKKALGILSLVCKIISESGTIPRDDKVIQPTARWPAVVLVIDEIDALIELCGAQAKRMLGYIATKDRSESVSLIAAGQRATADWMGGSDVRTQLDVVCAGRVRRQAEINHAVGNFGPLIPDMATYGEGHSGVWAIVEDSGSYDIGRSFDLSELTDIRQIAWDRRDGGPRLNPVLSDRIGDLYVKLREMQLAEYHDGDLAEASPAAEPAWAAEGAEDGDGVPAGDTVTLTRAPVYGEAGDALDQELEDLVPDELKDRLKEIDRKINSAEQVLRDNPMPDMSGITPEQRAEFVQARWDQAAERTEIPPEARARLLGLLSGDGISGRKATEAFPDAKRWQVMFWLNRLRAEKVAWLDGKGRNARWKLTTGGGDDAGE